MLNCIHSRNKNQYSQVAATNSSQVSVVCDRFFRMWQLLPSRPAKMIPAVSATNGYYLTTIVHGGAASIKTLWQEISVTSSSSDLGTLQGFSEIVLLVTDGRAPKRKVWPELIAAKRGLPFARLVCRPQLGRYVLTPTISAHHYRSCTRSVQTSNWLY